MVALFMLLIATPYPAITQERRQVGGANQKLTKESVPQQCESEMFLIAIALVFSFLCNALRQPQCEA